MHRTCPLPVTVAFTLGTFRAVWTQVWLFRQQGMIENRTWVDALCYYAKTIYCAHIMCSRVNDTCIYCMCVAWSQFSAACRILFKQQKKMPSCNAHTVDASVIHSAAHDSFLLLAKGLFWGGSGLTSFHASCAISN